MNIPDEWKMDDAQWNALIHKVAELYNNLTIMRGFQYYKQKRVGPLFFSNRQTKHHDTSAIYDHTRSLTESDSYEAGTITAEVQGTEAYTVVLYMEALSTSRCTCPVNTPCKHMAAVLMSYAEQQGRPVPALVNAHATTSLKQVAKPVTMASSGRAYRFGGASDGEPTGKDHDASDGRQYSEIKEQASELAGMSIPEWHELFRDSLRRLGTGTATTAYIQEASDELYAIKPKLSTAMDQLFELQVLLYLMRYCIPPARNSITNTPVYLSYPAQLAVDTLQKSLEALLLQPLDCAGLQGMALEQFQARLGETAGYLRKEMMPETANMMFFTPVYSKLWLNWIVPQLQGKSDLLQTELGALNSIEEDAAKQAKERMLNGQRAVSKVTLPLPLVLAQGWMHYHLKQDTAAWQKLVHGSTAYGIPPEHLLQFLHILVDAAEWTRLVEWLVQLGPMLTNRRSTPLQDYMQLWNIAIQHVPESEHRMWDTLVSMLPHSRPAYEDAMHSRAQWRRWIDFQLSTGTEPLEFRVAVLQPIEKEAPELLLPFYHQAVERYIGHKNRDGYKAAVKLLKRLSKIYKKLKHDEQWEHFITTIAVRNSRLRALQEELRKGKLIP
ncbi:SWIM zinc finger family protein [Paenibacillus barcinonensis]|nr:SWIM zinc finger family protein [Paenibacillus barcinonensis]